MNLLEPDFAARRPSNHVARSGVMAFFLIAWFGFLTTAPVAAEQRLALVVGNSAYQSMTKLDETENDAKLIADTLRGVGFSLVGGAAQINLDKAGLDAALQSFGHQLAGADIALFFYAGHGIRLGEVNYLVPVGAHPTSEADAEVQLVDIAQVLRQMEGAGTRLNLVMLDACRGNPLPRGLGTTGGGLAPMRAPERTLISLATQPGHVAEDGRDGHSPYSTALAQTIRRAGLDVLQTFNEAGLAVMRATGGRQQPWLSSSPIDGSFYFVAAPRSVRAASSAADDAAQAWSAARDTPSPAVLEAFIKTYGTSFYASLAKARLDQLNAAAAAKPSPHVSASERVLLYDEDMTNPKGVQHVGSVVWRLETIKTAGKPDDLAIHADIEVPDRKLKMVMSMVRNGDPSLPASHIANLTFILPPDFADGEIRNVPGILAKESESARGTPLASLAVKVTRNFFLVGLSSQPGDRVRNSKLLLERAWLDIPLIYSNQHRAILAIEKGPTGDMAFQAAFAAWGQTPEDTAPQQP